MKFTELIYKSYSKAVYILYLVPVIALILLCYVLYNKYAEKKKNHPDIANENRRTVTIDVYFFNVDWCPHCTSAIPVWKEFVKEYDQQTINNYTINCIGKEKGINCSNEKDPDVAELTAKMKIDKFPTIKLIKDEIVIDFAAKITKDNLVKCINNL